LVARHFHVAAEEDGSEAEIRLTLLEPEQPRTETKAEGLYLYVEEAGGPIMTKLLNQNHDPNK
jgi:hypothetical protein